jgi:hypothetical protein
VEVRPEVRRQKIIRQNRNKGNLMELGKYQGHRDGINRCGESGKS